MFFVYVLHSFVFARHYVGITTNLKRRLKEHNLGKTKSTKGYVPWEIVHYEKFRSRVEARDREKYLKSAAGRIWRKKILK